MNEIKYIRIENVNKQARRKLCPGEKWRRNKRDGFDCEKEGTKPDDFRSPLAEKSKRNSAGKIKHKSDKGPRRSRLFIIKVSNYK